MTREYKQEKTVFIAAKHQVGYGLVVKYAKLHNLSRRRGRRKKLEE